MKRTANEPAFVLHRYDWSESSLILEVFTRAHGRIALAAKGAKRPSSSLRPVLLPLQPLTIAFGGEGEIRNLKAAEWAGGLVMPTGEALLAGYHANELLLRLLARDDAHPRLFDAYAELVRQLAGAAGAPLEAPLRAFELVLLREAGHLPALDADSATLAELAQDQGYALRPEAGLAPATLGDAPVLPGATWRTLEAALGRPRPQAALAQALAGPAAAALPSLKAQLRTLLHYHCGAGVLRTRQLMIDLQNL